MGCLMRRLRSRLWRRWRLKEGMGMTLLTQGVRRISVFRRLRIQMWILEGLQGKGRLLFTRGITGSGQGYVTCQIRLAGKYLIWELIWGRGRQFAYSSRF